MDRNPVGWFEIYVANLHRARAFYESLLGVKLEPFTARSKTAVDEFHQAALAAGGKDNGKPGPRTGAGQYYGAFVLDPDGNNIEACVRGASAG
jgi:predicted enzyme related to lactoylglutathione lyase